MDTDDLNPAAKGMAIFLSLASGIFALWCTIIAFAGGTLPLLGWKMAGGIGAGLVWLFIVDPILIGICYVVSLVIVVPLGLLLRK
jgi:hypothetical protein